MLPLQLGLQLQRRRDQAQANQSLRPDLRLPHGVVCGHPGRVQVPAERRLRHDHLHPQLDIHTHRGGQRHSSQAGLGSQHRARPHHGQETARSLLELLRHHRDIPTKEIRSHSANHQLLGALLAAVLSATLLPGLPHRVLRLLRSHTAQVQAPRQESLFQVHRLALQLSVSDREALLQWKERRVLSQRVSQGVRVHQVRQHHLQHSVSLAGYGGIV